jgi:hypothetical protein
MDIVHIPGPRGQADDLAEGALRYIIGGRGEVEMYWQDDDWASIINRVMRRVGDGPKLDVLQMHSHGREDTGAMFSGRLTERQLAQYQSSFRRLGTCFKPDGQLYLKGCGTARQQGMMRTLADLADVDVTAGFADQRSGQYTDVFLGRTLTVTRDGVYRPDAPGILRQAAI